MEVRTEIGLQSLASGRLVGARGFATPLRHELESAIADGREVVLNFAGVEATQSFVDELIGALILRNGPSVLNGMIFQNCSESVRAIVRFVAADRSDQFAKSH